MKEIVDYYSLEARYTKHGHTSLHNRILKLLSKVERMMNNTNYLKYVSDKQKSELDQAIRKLW